MKQKIEELQVAFAALDKKYQEIKADGMENKEEMMMDCLSMIRNISSRLDYISNATWDYQYNHGKGHLPPIKTASQMEKALKMCGMDEDYEVEKPSLYVSASTKRGMELEVSYTKKQ